MAIKNHNTEHRVNTHTYNPAVLIRHSLKYKNTVSQKTFYRDRELQMSSKILRGGKEKKEEAGKGGKRGDLIDVSCHLQIPRHYWNFPWASREGRTGTRPSTRIWVLCQEGVISLQSSAQAEALRPDSCIQNPGTRKMGRMGRAKERKERGKGREGRGEICLACQVFSPMTLSWVGSRVLAPGTECCDS